ncbi:hypothetical protein SAMN04488081_0889 [Salimicrobium album]|uniref:Uncharacterized protein n=2 Tax=Salimicrobium album TaxID=50717 RepID=A0A1H3DB69_9BACI|nr:hypothetical protein SAMN04488081_0889 [Salimicrobium album]
MLIVIGALLGDGYQDNLYLYWLTVMILLIVYSEFIMNEKDQLTTSLNEAKEKVSQLTILKSRGESGLAEIVLAPKDNLKQGRESKIEIFVATQVPMSPPDIKIQTEIEWEVKVSNQPQSPKHYGGKYEYILRNAIEKSYDRKFFKYGFFVKVDETGDHYFSLEINNGSIITSTANSIKVS